MTRGLVKAAIRLAADAPLPGSGRRGRTLIKRSLIDDLRRELDIAGFGDDWRVLQRIIRDEEKKPAGANV